MAASQTNELLDAALAYAARGWKVFPLHTPLAQPTRTGAVCSCGKKDCTNVGKHPRTKNGLKDGTTDPAQIRVWWGEMWPAANIGLACGAGFVAIDVDPARGGLEHWEELCLANGGLPVTPVALTGSGGRHVFLRVEGAVPNSANALAQGVDVRGDGGYVVAAPSLHKSGRRYAWELSADPEDVPMADAPAWLAGLLGRKRVASAVASTAGETISEGGRNETLFHFARSLRAKDLSEEEILPALLAMNARRCVPPLDDREVETIVRSACSVAPGQSDTYRPRHLRPVPDPPAAEGGEPNAEPDAWRSKLVRRPDQSIVRSFGNLCTILRADPAFAGQLAYDESRRMPVLRERPLTDGDVGRLREDLERRLRVAFGDDMIRQAMLTVAEERSFHPAREYLQGLRWDGTPRIDQVCERILGIEPAHPALALYRRMVRCWFLSAARRPLQPGSKFDEALVLVGKQGLRKSTFFSVLGGEYFSDTSIDIANKDSYLQLSRFWIIEWSELESVTSRKQAFEVKAFLSKRSDDFRPPYGRSLIEAPRTCALVGSTNQGEFLEDETGNRRFWCIRVTQRIDTDLLAARRDQLWAEAVAAVAAGETSHLSEDEDRAHESDTEQYAVGDPWATPLQRWATKQTRPDWTAEEILSECFSVPRKDHTKGDAMRLGKLLRAMGWERRKLRLVRDGKTSAPAWAWVSPARTEGQDDEPAD